jgi:hypothetical protein
MACSGAPSSFFMKQMDPLDLFNALINFLTFVVAIVAVIGAYKTFRLQDFAEVFLMPQQIVGRNAEGKEEHIGWNLLVKNASSYPIYINKYIFNNVEAVVGGSVIPTHSDSWYVIPIPAGVTEFQVSVDFADHRGNKYRTEGRGVLVGNGWSIHSVRRTEI